MPSLATTIVITALFGLLGLIPAHIHGKRAESLGVPAGRYWKAFAITFAVVAMTYIAFLILFFTFILGVETAVNSGVSQRPSMASTQARTTASPPTESAEAPPGADVTWSVASLTPLLDAFADDEAEAWASFSSDSVVTIPCGGEGAHGVSPATIERVAGGSQYGASAQVLTDGGSASREFDRLTSLVADCGPHDYISRDSGTVLTRCDAPIVASLAPVIRYEQVCDIAPGIPYAFALIQSGNAIVGLSAPSAAELDSALPTILAQLGAG